MEQQRDSTPGRETGDRVGITDTEAGLGSPRLVHISLVDVIAHRTGGGRVEGQGRPRDDRALLAAEGT